MFYEPRKRDHGMRFDPFKALVVPRPIGWISTLNPDGSTNVAPYSMFNAVGDNPPMVMFAASSRTSDALKDSPRNAAATGDFVVNVVSRSLVDLMNETSAPFDAGVSEFEVTGLEWAPSNLVRSPRILRSPASLECVFFRNLELPSTREGVTQIMTIGEVVGIHISDAIIIDGRVRCSEMEPVARLGYMDYTVIRETFEVVSPSRQGVAFAKSKPAG